MSPEQTRAIAGSILHAAAGSGPFHGPCLVVLSGPDAGKRHLLAANETLGRGLGATIAIPDPKASRIHAKVTLNPGSATVEDFSSKNGTWLNGVRVEAGCTIRSGDELTIGETLLAFEGPTPPEGMPARSAAARANPPGADGPVRKASLQRLHLAAAILLLLSATALALSAG